MANVSLTTEQGATRATLTLADGRATSFDLHFTQPAKFINELELFGAALRKAVKTENQDAELNKTQDYYQLLRAHITPTGLALNEEARHYMHAFDVCWEDATHNDRPAHVKKLKADLNRSQRHNINLARNVVKELVGYNHDFSFNNINDESQRLQALQALQEVEAAITNLETKTQSVLRYLGYFLGGIFALAQGGNNGKSMGASIIAICSLAGIAGLSMGLPYIAIPAIVIGLSSFVINALIAVKASGNTFKNLFGRDSVFEPLYKYSHNGDKLSFTNNQTIGFLTVGLIPTLFSAICLSALGGYVLLLTLAAVPFLAPFALPIALTVTISCATALFFVYLQDTAKQFHIRRGASGMTAVKEFASEFFNPTRCINDKMNAYRAELNGLPKNNEGAALDAAIQAHTSKVQRVTNVLKPIFIVLALAGIGLTLFGAAIAVPSLFPFISFPVAVVMAALAMPGQMPFYNNAAAKLAFKVAKLFTREPAEIKDARQRAQANNATAAAPTEEEQPLLTARAATSREATKATQAQTEFNQMSPLNRIWFRTKQVISNAISALTTFSKAGNPLGNGAIAMVGFIGISWITGTFSAILLPITFILASFASAAVGYSTDPEPVDNTAPENRFNALFREKDLTSTNKITNKHTLTAQTKVKGITQANTSDITSKHRIFSKSNTSEEAQKPNNMVTLTA